MAGSILAADIGTSSLKAAFIDTDGKLLAFCRTPYKADQNGNLGADAWERAFAAALETLHSQAPGCVIDAICISGNGPTLTPVTTDGDVLPPLYWHDGRTVLPQLSSPYSISSYFLPHVAWLKKNAFPLYKKTKYFISSHEWLASRLGAEPRTVLPSRAYEPYYWDDEQCGIFDLDREKFPPFIKMGDLMGHVSKNTSSFLKSGTPIIAGGPDFITALIGTGITKPGDVCNRAGSSEGVNVCAASPVKKGKFRLLPHAVEGLWNIGIVINSSGSLFERYRKHAGLENTSYEELLAELLPSTGDTDIFRELPFFTHIDNAFPHSPFPASCSPVNLGRAVLCAMGFSVRSALGALAESGLPVSLMRVSGGQGKNSRWNQLKADITGVSLMVPMISDGELAGNAVLASVALENAPGREKEVFQQAASRIIRFRDIYEPRSDIAEFWEQRYRLYKSRAVQGK
jgi:sugar (pentulose or hexulose) kinase